MIITITLNPAIDETVEVDRLVQADTNRVVAIRRDIGGKGVNVARVLKELGYEPLAMGSAPGRFGGMIEEQLKKMAEAAANELPGGEILLLENLRFHAEEEANDAGFAKRLAALGVCGGDTPGIFGAPPSCTSA